MVIPASLLLLSLLVAVSADAKIGVTYGTSGNNLPTPSKSTVLINSIKASQVKLYGLDPQILNSLNGTHLDISIVLPNSLTLRISSNRAFSDHWIRTHILPFHTQTRIRYLLVGNNILSDQALKQTWPSLVQAMKNIKLSLKTLNITKIKVSSPISMDVLQDSFPPSNATFRTDIANSVVKPMLYFLSKHNSFLFVNVFTYFEWSKNFPKFGLDYALLNDGALKYTDPGSGLTYTNLLDQLLDAFVFAMKKLGSLDVSLFIAETGWPNGCNIDEIGGNAHNAATYNRNLVKKLTTNPPIGTPARPGEALPSFIHALYNENQRPGPGSERHWGLFYPNGANVYPIDLSGKTPSSEYPSIALGSNNSPYKGKVWCVLARGANMSRLGEALSDVCSRGDGACDAIQPGRECYRPDLLVLHASYAFSSYWAKFRSRGDKCFFKGLAVLTTKDPSHGSCKYPSVTLH